jgi:hypothetical protein
MVLPNRCRLEATIGMNLRRRHRLGSRYSKCAIFSAVAFKPHVVTNVIVFAVAGKPILSGYIVKQGHGPRL